MTDTPSPNPPAGRIRVSSEQGVGWVVLDNPRKHNAMSLAMWGALADALAGFAQDPAVRCVVLRGEGDKAFCAGADIAEKQGKGAEQSAADSQLSQRGLEAVHGFAKPVIAMIDGYCLGGGLALALACDMRISATSGIFGIPAAKLGLAYNYNAIKRLTELVGPAQARQILFTADRLPAQRALQLGLVNEVVEPDQLQDFVRAMAGRIAANAPLTIAAAKQAIATAVSDAPGRDLAGCEERMRACLASDDYAEGRRAFQEKRAPVFQGR
ncbi:MAG TPA: enoyl-CoA hydratase [Ramlibacter sp.]|nr:enoyl-CoA hydratase [Ramlibacter sp.]